jgi:hypothetical protein
MLPVPIGGSEPEFVRFQSGFNKTVSRSLKACPNNSAVFGRRQPPAAFASSVLRGRSGRGLPQSKTLPRDSLNPVNFPATVFLKLL